jgi:hypothetical protein
MPSYSSYLTADNTSSDNRRGACIPVAFFNTIEQCRRVTARNDKLAANYLAFIKVALQIIPKATPRS